MSELHGFVTTRKQRDHELRNVGVNRAKRFLLMGHRRAALEFLMIAVEQQARLAGIRDVHLPRPIYPDIEP